jgi:hypothetical protein
MTLAVPRSNWQLQENSYGDAYHEKSFKLTRIYEFADPRATTTICTLQIACAGISVSLAGHVHAYVDFNLRPHRYLGLGELPPQDDGMITAPFSVSLIAEGAGTEDSPLLQGGVWCKVFWSSDDDEPELLPLRVRSIEDEVQCLKAMQVGKDMTFTILAETEPYQKLQLRLPNDGEFRRLYGDICNRLKREVDNWRARHRSPVGDLRDALDRQLHDALYPKGVLTSLFRRFFG